MFLTFKPLPSILYHHFHYTKRSIGHEFFSRCNQSVWSLCNIKQECYNDSEHMEIISINADDKEMVGIAQALLWHTHHGGEIDLAMIRASMKCVPGGICYKEFKETLAVKCGTCEGEVEFGEEEDDIGKAISYPPHIIFECKASSVRGGYSGGKMEYYNFCTGLTNYGIQDLQQKIQLCREHKKTIYIITQRPAQLMPGEQLLESVGLCTLKYVFLDSLLEVIRHVYVISQRVMDTLEKMKHCTRAHEMAKLWIDSRLPIDVWESAFLLTPTWVQKCKKQNVTDKVTGKTQYTIIEAL